MSYPADLIACPGCHQALQTVDAETLRCPACDRDFTGRPNIDFTPIPPPDAEVRERWPLWEKLQSNFLAAATAVPEHSLSVTPRPDADAFARFCKFTGTVLDIGCGTQRLPTYADVHGCRFIGIDPLPGEPERAFEFVHGLGEFLPFRSDCFDQVLFATSLDHMLVPRRAVAEAQRVLRAGGAVNVWFGEVDRPEKPPGWLERAKSTLALLRDRNATDQSDKEPAYIAVLDRPEGAIDKFHVSYPSVREVEGFFTAAGLERCEIERVEFANGCFVRGLKRG